MTNFILFETERLQIIKYSVDRLDEIFEIYRDADIINYTMKDGKPKSKDELLKGIAAYNDMYTTNQGRWLIIDKATDIAIGFVGIFYIDEIDKTELSYALIKKARSNGFATEALTGLKKYALEVLKLTEICSLICVGNTSSEKVAKRAGMHYQNKIASLWGYEFKVMNNFQLRFHKDSQISIIRATLYNSVILQQSCYLIFSLRIFALPLCISAV